MFLGFNEGSFLWEWHHSSLWLVAFLTGILAVALATAHSASSVTGRTLKILAFGSVVLTIPLGMVRLGLAPGFMDSGVIGELGFIGFTGSMVSIALPFVVGIILHSLRPDLLNNRRRPAHHAQSIPEPGARVDDFPIDAVRDRRLSDSRVEPTLVPEGWELTFLDGSSAERTYRLSEPEIILGRSPSCDLVIDDPYVSRKHAKLSFQAGVLSLTDMGSRSGTIVDGTATHSSILRQGSKAVLGETTIGFSKTL